MEMNKKEYAKEYQRWLREYSWSFYANLKFPLATNWMQRDYMFDMWISSLRREEGAKDFHWVRVAETRFMKTRPDFHVWVGGTRSRSEYWAARWKQLGGSATIENFDLKRTEAFCRVAVETMDDDDILQVESDFPQKETIRRDSERNTREPGKGSVKLRVDSLDENTSLGKLRYQFEKFGRVEEISIHMGETLDEEALVYALVTMSLEDARLAKRSLNASDLEFQDVTWPRRYYGPWFSPGWRPPK
jgi:hypothetical protein